MATAFDVIMFVGVIVAGAVLVWGVVDQHRQRKAREAAPPDSENHLEQKKFAAGSR